MPPTFRRCRRVTRLCRRPQQENDMFMRSASKDEFFGVQQRPGEILEHAPSILSGVNQSCGLFQLSWSRRAAEGGPIKSFNEIVVGLPGIQKRRQAIVWIGKHRVNGRAADELKGLAHACVVRTLALA